MNKLILVILIVLTSLFATSKDAKAGLQSVKLYSNGAELTHNVSLNLSKGNNLITILNLANDFDEKSIQASIKGEGTILSVKKSINYLRNKEESTQIKNLENQIEQLTKEVASIKNNIDILNIQNNLLINTKISGESTKLSVKELSDYIDYVESKLVSIKTKIADYDKNKSEKEKEILKIRQQLSELNQSKKPSTEIILEIFSNREAKSDLLISYNTWNTGWNVSYNIKAENLSKPLKVEYKANIFQNTGLDWNNVDLTLSTMQPFTGSKPEINTWFLDIEIPRPMISMSKKTLAPQEARFVSDKQEEINMLESDSYAGGNIYESVQTTLSVEFKPTIKYTIPSDGKSYSVKINDLEIEADFEYYTAPRYNKEIFLIAKLKNWQNYNLLSGEANLYLENAFVGTTFISSSTNEEKLDLTFGRDKRIVVEHKQLKDFKEDKFLSKNVERFFNYEIKINNNRSENIKLIIEDNIPISKNEDIVVNLNEGGNHKFNKTTGILTWELNIAPSKQQILNYGYSVKYPGDKTIIGLNY